MKNALRQLVGEKAHRPSPMEILLVLERQKIRLELLHQDVCEQIEKTTDLYIRGVRQKGRGERLLT